MNDIKADLKKNRLYITLKDAANSDIEDLIEKIERECGKLEKGFSCLNDITDYDPDTLESESLLMKAQKKLWQAGLGVIVNLSRNKKLEGHYQLEKASKLSAGYSAIVVSNPQEAEEVLDGKTMQDQVCLAVKKGALERFSRLASFRKEDTLEFIESVLSSYLDEQKTSKPVIRDNVKEPKKRSGKTARRRGDTIPLLLDKIEFLTEICQAMNKKIEALEKK